MNTTTGTDRPRGTGPFYLVALVCSSLSLDTAARYFHGPMGINGIPIHGVSVELAAICGVGELTLIACGYAMRHSVRRDGKPGVAQLVALAMCSAATFMAFALDGPVAGAIRAFFGPILALVTLHLALGIEVKVHKDGSVGAWAKVVGEMHERVMSRLGLGDDERKAAERSRDRARERAARIATDTGWVLRRQQRLVKAVRASGATLDAAQRNLLVEQVAVLKNIEDLTNVEVESPWSAAVPTHVQRFVEAAQRSIEAQREAADRDASVILADAQRAAAALTGAAQQQAEAQQRTAAQRVAEAQSEAALIRSAADKVAAEERRAADDYRRQAEQRAQQQYEQLMAAALVEADRMRDAARTEAGALRSTVSRSTELPARTAAPQRSNGRSAASADDLVNALAQRWLDEIPSERSAIVFLRERFNGCGDQRARDAVAALRTRRDAARSAADPERLQVTAKINGSRPELASSAA